MRTEEKRDEIVRIASEAFNELGYDRCSMATISDRLGGSKATLYGYFASKEDLLRAVLQCQVEGEFERALNDFPEEGDLRSALVKFGGAYHRKRLSSLPVANIRCVMNQPPCSSMGKEFYETVMRPAFQNMANKLEYLMDQGQLKRADPWVVLMHWKGLLDWDLFERRIMGAISGPEDIDSAKIVELATDAFLKLYGAEQSASH